MKIAVWIVQGLLIAAFLMAGATKLTTPIDGLVQKGMTFASQVPEGLVRFAGLAEVLGAIGLLLPSVLRIKPQLSVFAAGGLVLTMLGAVATHVSLGEMDKVGAPIVLAGLAAFVAWARLGKVQIEARA